jgi:hypothetical protein
MEPNHHSQPLTLSTKPNPTVDMSRLMTAITLSGHPRTSRLRIPASPPSQIPRNSKCLLRDAHHQPGLLRPKTMPRNSASPSRRPNLLSSLSLNPRYPPNSTLLHHVLPSSLSRTTTEIGIEEICHEMCLQHQPRPDHAVATKDNSSVPSHRPNHNPNPGHGR